MAIYENLLEELNKTKRFKQVLREGDSKASEVSDLLILKTTVVKYTAGSETRRAVTTVSGATKLTVQSQLITRDGKILLDRSVKGTFGSSAAISALRTIWRAISPKGSSSRIVIDARRASVTPADEHDRPSVAGNSSGGRP